MILGGENKKASHLDWRRYKNGGGFFQSKNIQCKTAILKNAIKPPGYYTFSEVISGKQQ